MKFINDPLYGTIKINKTESKIINSPIFQRLRDIKQLGLAYYIYPTATHNRFSHSIGVMYLADKIFTTLRNKFPTYKESFDDEILKNLRMAALLHDIGHFPFSHSLEFKNEDFDQKEIPKIFLGSHEKLGEYIIRQSYIKDLLDTEGYNLDLVCGIIRGKSTEHLVLNNIIHWELDADRMDYLLRDSYFTGVNLGLIDYIYLIENLHLINEEFPILAINEKAVRSIENILTARFCLYDRVYTHKSVSYFNFILKRIVKDHVNSIFPDFFFDEKTFRTVIEKNESILLRKFTDSYIISKLFELYDKIDNKSYDLKALLYRTKFDYINRERYISKESRIKIDDKTQKIKDLLKILDSKFETKDAVVRINTPLNQFTKFKSTPNSNWDIDISTELEAKCDNDIGGIVIIDKDDALKSFFQWNGSYFKYIFDLCTYKFDIYINKQNPLINSNYKKKTSLKIKEILNFI